MRFKGTAYLTEGITPSSPNWCFSEIVTSALFDSDGKVLGFSNNLNDRQREIALPANYANERGWLTEWWNDRAVPLTRDGILDFLKKEGYSMPTEYLF